MNEKPRRVTFSSSEAEHAWRRGVMEVDQIRLGWLEAMSRHPALELQDDQNLTLGYVTKDVGVPALWLAQRTYPDGMPFSVAARRKQEMATIHPTFR
jgi:hypothetical protein